MAKFVFFLKICADCWGDVCRAEKGSSLLLDLSEVSSSRGVPRFGFSALHLQVLRGLQSPAFVSYMLLQIVFPSISIEGSDERPP